jgi:hypothetical protein
VQRVGAYGPEQLVNAAVIIRAGKAMGLFVRDQTIGVMTTMGESSLMVVNHGDAAGPDSRGPFQQRANGAWGSGSDRMNPTFSATNFFKALTGVGGRGVMTPMAVAHAVQRNADPLYNAKYWNDAVAVVTKLTASGVRRGGSGRRPGPTLRPSPTRRCRSRTMPARCAAVARSVSRGRSRRRRP